MNQLDAQVHTVQHTSSKCEISGISGNSTDSYVENLELVNFMVNAQYGNLKTIVIPITKIGMGSPINHRAKPGTNLIDSTTIEHSGQ